MFGMQCTYVKYILSDDNGVTSGFAQLEQMQKHIVGVHQGEQQAPSHNIAASFLLCYFRCVCVPSQAAHHEDFKVL